KGKHLGRPVTVGKQSSQIEKLHSAGISKAEIARRLDIGRTSVRRILADLVAGRNTFGIKRALRSREDPGIPTPDSNLDQLVRTVTASASSSSSTCARRAAHALRDTEPCSLAGSQLGRSLVPSDFYRFHRDRGTMRPRAC